MLFKKEDESVTELTEEEFINILANVAENISKEAGKEDIFFKLTLQTLLLKYAKDVTEKIFNN